MMYLTPVQLHLLDLLKSEYITYALLMPCFVVHTQFSFSMGSGGCTDEEEGAMVTLYGSDKAWPAHGLHAKESWLGPSPCALQCAPALSNGSSYTHSLSFCLFTSPSLFIRAVFPLSVTSLLHLPVAVLLLMHLSME